jgi:hypothetical protein
MLTDRFALIVAKIRAAKASGTLTERLVHKLKVTLYVPLIVSWRYLRLKPEDRRLPIKAGFADHRVRDRSVQGKDDESIFDRIRRAYLAAKAGQVRAPEHFQIRGLWREWIDAYYGPLVGAVTKGDIKNFMALLENFCREPFATGTGASYDEFVRVNMSLFGRMYVKVTWCDYRDKLLDGGYDLSHLSFPMIGNPGGIPFNNCVIQIDTLRHASSALATCDIVKDISSPIIAEIGGGFGGQAYQTFTLAQRLGRPIGKYLDFDIPEVLIVASYFLLKSIPAEKIVLFGESQISDPFCVGMFPNFSIDELTDRSADVIFNSHSFSEMDKSSSLHYLSVVNRVCRKYFFHINHEQPLEFRQMDGSVSRNVVGSQMVPDLSQFKRLYKSPRLSLRPEDTITTFSYLYERL